MLNLDERASDGIDRNMTDTRVDESRPAETGPVECRMRRMKGDEMKVGGC